MSTLAEHQDRSRHHIQPARVDYHRQAAPCPTLEDGRAQHVFRKVDGSWKCYYCDETKEA